MIPKLNRLYEAVNPVKAFEAKWKTAFKAFGRDVDALNKKHGVDPEESEPAAAEEPAYMRAFDALVKKHLGPLVPEYKELKKKFGNAPELEEFGMEISQYDFL